MGRRAATPNRSDGVAISHGTKLGNAGPEVHYMVRALAAAAAIALAVFALALLGLVTSDQPLPGADLTWFAPFAQIAGVIAGAICLAAAVLLIGLAFGHWRHPLRDPSGHERT